jgi:hypothetical protein
VEFNSVHHEQLNGVSVNSKYIYIWKLICVGIEGDCVPLWISVESFFVISKAIVAIMMLIYTMCSNRKG